MFYSIGSLISIIEKSIKIESFHGDNYLVIKIVLIFLLLFFALAQSNYRKEFINLL
jgi:hypothetical protein